MKYGIFIERDCGKKTVSFFYFEKREYYLKLSYVAKVPENIPGCAD